MLRPKRPWPIWSAVTICLAAKTGLTKATCSVPKVVISCVEASRPQAQVSVSKVVPCVSLWP
jgi:hypothetical protein